MSWAQAPTPDAKIKAKATAIAGADFARHHTLGLDEYKSIEVQQIDHEGGGCSVEGAGIVDVTEMANTMAHCADRVAACQCRVPPVFCLDELLLWWCK